MSEFSEPSEEESSGSDSDEPLELKLDQFGRVLANTAPLNFNFRSFNDILGVSANPQKWHVLCQDLSMASTKNRVEKTVDDTEEDYSEGQTFWLPADATPTSALEKIALDIFQYHTKGCGFDASNSGAEWWTLAIDSEHADVAWHWDKDYGLEESGINLSPHLATVTYLSLVGAPTVMLSKTAPTEYTKDFSGTADQMFISRPRIGKHSSFDGRFLHSAPMELSLWSSGGGSNSGGDSGGVSGGDSGGDSGGGNSSNRTSNSCSSSSSSSSSISSSSSSSSSNSEIPASASNNTEKSSKNTTRYSLLVNIWLNWKPQDAIRCPKSMLQKLSVTAVDTDFSNESTMVLLESVGQGKEQNGVNTQQLSWNFTMGEQKAAINVSVPVDDVKGALSMDINVDDGSLLVTEKQSTLSKETQTTVGFDVPLVVVETIKENSKETKKRKRDLK